MEGLVTRSRPVLKIHKKGGRVYVFSCWGKSAMKKSLHYRKAAERNKKTINYSDCTYTLTRD